MAKAPSFNFYSSDFLSQTMFLSFEDKGKLIMLLCLQHQHGHLKKEQMLKACGKISDDLWEFFQADAEGKYFNEQIDIATEKRKNFINKQKNNISKRWNKFGNTKSIPNEYQKDTNQDSLVIPLENENEIEKEKDYEIGKTEKENKVVREKGKKFVKPTKEEVLEFAKEEKLRTDIVDKWFNHYEANGWKVGHNSMKNWKASYRNWNLNSYDSPKNKSSNPFLERLKKLEEQEKVIDVEGV